MMVDSAILVNILRLFKGRVVVMQSSTGTTSGQLSFCSRHGWLIKVGWGGYGIKVYNPTKIEIAGNRLTLYQDYDYATHLATGRTDHD